MPSFGPGIKAKSTIARKGFQTQTIASGLAVFLGNARFAPARQNFARIGSSLSRNRAVDKSVFIIKEPAAGTMPARRLYVPRNHSQAGR
jgi:hypothetical protein